VWDDLLKRSPANSTARLELAQARNELGRIYTFRRQFTEAREAHLAALALLQDNGTVAPAVQGPRFELARTYYFLGSQERPLPAAARHDGAGPGPGADAQRESLAKAVALLDVEPAARATPEVQHLLALCYLEGAGVSEARGRRAQGGVDRAIEILEGLVRDFPNDLDYAFDLSEAYTRGQVPRPGAPAETQRATEEHFAKSLALLDKLVTAHRDVPDFAAAEARVYDKLGAFYRQLERWPEAEGNFRKAIAIQTSLVKQFPEVPYYGLWLANFRIALGDVLTRQNQASQAAVELQEAVSSLLQEGEVNSGAGRPHELLALGYSKLATALRQAGERERADEASRKAEEERNAGRAAP
jgi:tetratricopeptide (TPR) repeat protein